MHVADSAKMDAKDNDFLYVRFPTLWISHNQAIGVDDAVL